MASFGISSPPTHLFSFPPANLPETIPSPPGDGSLAHPFGIPSGLYNAVLAAPVPLTIAAVYATTVTYVNKYNRDHGNKPWAISKTRAFHVFVLAHNIFLAVYSAWTFVGMYAAIRESVPSPFNNEYGLVGTIDGLCKINGPRGLGSAATYDPTSASWSIKNSAFKLGFGDAPDAADVGRMWNEGLAFYGWFFYLSKFYEVLDTFIILAKGKRSSTLQTYHHAGAMMSMWAGMRYMAPPIWMFCLVNSGIHALMYTYYTLTALSVPVPLRVKRTLTTMQITQFLVGTAFATAHLFVHYKVPVTVSFYETIENITSALPSAASAVASSVSSAATVTATAGVNAWLKKFAFRAAGYEGLAENVRNEEGQQFGIDAVHAVQDAEARRELRQRLEYTDVKCLDTSGEVFAVLFNIFYLMPLTFLFGRFFYRSYIKTGGSKGHRAEKAGKDALKGVGRQITDAVNTMHGAEPDVDTTEPSTTSSKSASSKPASKSAVQADSEPKSYAAAAAKPANSPRRKA